MEYFKDFMGTITPDNNLEFVNLCRSIRLDSVLNEKYYVDYTLSDGETPEQLAYNLYGDFDYWWINLIVNQIQDPFYDWVLTYSELREYFNFLVDHGDLTGTDEEWQTLIAENDARREIKVLDPDYLGIFIYQVEQIIAAREES